MFRFSRDETGCGIHGVSQPDPLGIMLDLNAFDLAGLRINSISGKLGCRPVRAVQQGEMALQVPGAGQSAAYLRWVWLRSMMRSRRDPPA